MKSVNQTSTKPVPTTIIRPLRGWMPINLRELWAYRELLYFLTWRDIKVRYKQTLLGFAWAIIQPFVMMVAFTLLFGNLLNVPSEDIPYPLFSYAALLPWTLFAQGLTRSSESLVSNVIMVQKTYFPRLILPLASVLAPVIDFAVAFLILIGMMFYFGYPPTIEILWVIPLLILTGLTALSVGLWLSAINVRYRDVRYVLPFLIQLWLFASPVVYPTSLLSGTWQAIYAINPMVGIIDGFRWALLGTSTPSLTLAISMAIVVLLLISGAFYFRRMEKTFADII